MRVTIPYGEDPFEYDVVVDGVLHVSYRKKYTMIDGVEYKKVLGVIYWSTEKSWFVQIEKKGVLYQKHFYCDDYPNAYELACEARNKLKQGGPKIYEAKDQLRVVYYDNGEKKRKAFKYKKCGKEMAMQKAQHFIDQLNYTPYSPEYIRSHFDVKILADPSTSN